MGVRCAQQPSSRPRLRARTHARSDWAQDYGALRQQNAALAAQLAAVRARSAANAAVQEQALLEGLRLLREAAEASAAESNLDEKKVSSHVDAMGEAATAELQSAALRQAAESFSRMPDLAASVLGEARALEAEAKGLRDAAKEQAPPTER